MLIDSNVGFMRMKANWRILWYSLHILQQIQQCNADKQRLDEMVLSLILYHSMPKHKSPFERLVDPFSIPAQMNNLGVLIIAYFTKQIYARGTCLDQQNLQFLNFIYYGSMIVCIGTALMSIFYMVGLLDYCISKLPFGEVCLTLNMVLVFLLGLLYHCAATVFGLIELVWGQSSPCVELQMFKKITCWIYFCWFITIVLYLLVNCFSMMKKKELPVVDESYTEMK